MSTIIDQLSDASPRLSGVLNCLWSWDNKTRTVTFKTKTKSRQCFVMKQCASVLRLPVTDVSTVCIYAGSISIYSMYGNFTTMSGNSTAVPGNSTMMPGNSTYCNPTLYYFAFWVMNILVGLVGIVIVTLFIACFALCCYVLIKKILKYRRGSRNCR